MQTREPTIDELIAEHINELQQLATQDVEWVEAQSDLTEYIIHITTLEGNLLRHAERMLALHERVVSQIADKCGQAGHEIYSRELHNIRIRRRFSKLANYFTYKKKMTNESHCLTNKLSVSKLTF